MRIILRIISMVVLGAALHGKAFGQGAAGGSNGGDPVVQRLVLVGDAGELKAGHHPVCDWLKMHVNWEDTSNVLVYLGDNIYPHGMPDEGDAGREEAQKILDYQVS